MKRILSFLLAVVLTFGFAISVSAEELEQTPIMPRYTYIVATLVDLSVDADTGLTLSEAYFLTYDDTQEVQIECELQRYNNSKWNTVKTWTASGLGEAEVFKYWAVASGYTYRTYATFKVYDSNGNLVESVSYYDSQYIPPK